ncbi:NUDIX hydrolase [Prauserella flavalba]|uniref:DNA mismatch repair protein MutT n=1 Tax=Prauserella flavalba TaxID=1477506 RepID=A0A318LPA9_9PSEU|nr:NUDIX domain-containing protein [Prauserella flavalba]PXY36363.1 DNA mismatch repair protein MutT [Prauserella flavalba]
MTTIDKIAWLRIEDGRLLGARSRGKDVYYLPGGKREPGETDLETLTREIGEELTVGLDPATAVHAGTFEAPAHGRAGGTVVRMTCYTADYRGTLAPASEIEELRWLTCADRDRVSPVNQLILDHLHEAGHLR